LFYLSALVSTSLIRTLSSNFLCSEPGYPRTLHLLAQHIQEPAFPEALQTFLYLHEHPDTEDLPATLPPFDKHIRVHHSATALYYSPSDVCGAGGLIRETIRSSPSYRGGLRRDTIFVSVDSTDPGIKGIMVARVLLFFSFNCRRTDFSCALVRWFVYDGRDDDTGMWMVCPERGRSMLQVIDTDSIVRGAHLLPVHGNSKVPQRFSHFAALDSYRSFFVNHFVDHHAHELILG
jgi:hypothetical protein